MKLDLHLHTFRSPDSLSSYESIIRQVQRRGLDGIAVTDHNTMRGAFELAAMAPFPVILGEEIRTEEGEVIGYFLQEEIPRGLGLEETIARIREQGGVVAVPHPVDRVRRRSALGETVLRRVIDSVDIIEGHNGRCMRAADNRRALALATEFDKPISAGSDAHAPLEIGRCYVDVPPFESPTQFVQALRTARLVPSSGGRPWFVAWTMFAKLAQRTGLDRWVSF